MGASYIHRYTPACTQFAKHAVYINNTLVDGCIYYNNNDARTYEHTRIMYMYIIFVGNEQKRSVKGGGVGAYDGERPAGRQSSVPPP